MDAWEKKCVATAKKALAVTQKYPNIAVKLLLECWNSETPHFGGNGPHRYDGKAKTCAYCCRPKNWKTCNPGVTAGFLE